MTNETRNKCGQQTENRGTRWVESIGKNLPADYNPGTNVFHFKTCVGRAQDQPQPTAPAATTGTTTKEQRI